MVWPPVELTKYQSEGGQYTKIYYGQETNIPKHILTSI
jgi:hypothetical protein